MGYDTTYKGVITFKKELVAKQIAHLSQFLGEDIRDLKNLGPFRETNFYHFDLMFNKDFSGLIHTGAEKSHDIDDVLNFLTEQMRMHWPDFEMEGELFCQGESFDDRYKIVIENGVAKEVKIAIKGKRVTCPHCDEDFLLEE